MEETQAYIYSPEFSSTPKQRTHLFRETETPLRRGILLSPQAALSVTNSISILIELQFFGHHPSHYLLFGISTESPDQAVKEKQTWVSIRTFSKSSDAISQHF